jgi:hypothetical protein
VSAVEQPGLDLVWDEVEDRLHKTLRSRGVRPELADDVIQETAVRVIERGVAFTDANDLFRWSSVVAWHLAIDAARRDARQCDLPPDIASTLDVANEAVGRWWFEAVSRGLEQLSDAERAAIFSPAVRGDRKTTVRRAVRRHRARLRLMRLAETLGVGVALAAGRRKYRVRSESADAVAVAIASVAVAVVVAVGVATHRPGSAPVTTAPPVAVVRAAAPEVYAGATATTHPHAVGSLAARTNPVATPDTAVAPVRVPLELPTGSGDIGLRPKQPDEPLACATVASVGRPCVALPASITR